VSKTVGTQEESSAQAAEDDVHSDARARDPNEQTVRRIMAARSHAVRDLYSQPSQSSHLHRHRSVEARYWRMAGRLVNDSS
jgi:hypothetical protein